MTAIAEFRDRGSGVSQQALLVSGINPGSCYYTRAVAWADLMLVDINQRIKRCWVDQPFFDQQRFKRLNS